MTEATGEQDMQAFVSPYKGHCKCAGHFVTECHDKAGIPVGFFWLLH